MKEIQVSCPTCKSKFSYYKSDFRPFCSEKCRLIDLGQWLNESYAVQAVNLTFDEQEELIKLQEQHEEE